MASRRKERVSATGDWPLVTWFSAVRSPQSLLFIALLAGASISSAQVVPPPASEVPIPPKPPSDSTVPPGDSVPRDTLKPPIGPAPLPPSPSASGPYRWSRHEIFASGALTLTDLLHRIPELTTFRTGWIATPQAAALAGDFRRVRIYLDGVELDPIDPRERGTPDLAHIPIWSLDEVVVERAGGEVRVHMKSWSVVHTTPNTRTDVYTGNEETDIYRGFYGKRFSNGAVLQAAGEQSATEDVRFGGGGDALSLMVRTGVGRARWSVDAFGQRTHYNRVRQLNVYDAPGVPPYDAAHTFAYLRAIVGRQDAGPWVELIATTRRVAESGGQLNATDATALRVAADTADTAVTAAQYVARAGMSLGAVRLILADRVRRLRDTTSNSLSGTLVFDTRALSVTAFVERDDARESTLADAQLRLQPLPFFSVSAAASRRSFSDDATLPTTQSLRAEAGVRVFGIWAYAGTLSVSGRARELPSPYDTGGRSTGSDLTATFGGLRGVGWRGFGADAYVTKWSERDVYLPEYQARVELNFQTEWRRRFPRGDFGFKFAVADEYRSRVNFAGAGTCAGACPIQHAGASHVVWGLLEIRIMRGIISIQTRNPIGKSYFLVPGLQMPRAVTIYGMRWEFWG